MSDKVEHFLKKTLGEDFIESLSKVELWKPGTKSTIDHEELRTALQIVPRTVIALLIKELTPMSIGENKKVYLLVKGDAVLNITKHERDVYSGDIEQAGKIITEFKLRALPGVGLVIMSAFELYDMDNLINSPAPEQDDISEKVQKMIDERIALHDLVEKVVDKKLQQKEAIYNLILMKLTEELKEHRKKNIEQPVSIQAPIVLPEVAKKEEQASKVEKGSKHLKEFFESRKKKLEKKEYTIRMTKSEVNCPDCGKNIFDGKLFSGCICLGDDRERKVFIKKSEDGFKVRFGKGWDEENIEMLLEVLRKKHG